MSSTFKRRKTTYHFPSGTGLGPSLASNAPAYTFTQIAVSSITHANRFYQNSPAVYVRGRHYVSTVGMIEKDVIVVEAPPRLEYQYDGRKIDDFIQPRFAGVVLTATPQTNAGRVLLSLQLTGLVTILLNSEPIVGYSTSPTSDAQQPMALPSNTPMKDGDVDADGYHVTVGDVVCLSLDGMGFVVWQKYLDQLDIYQQTTIIDDEANSFDTQRRFDFGDGPRVGVVTKINASKDAIHTVVVKLNA